MSEAFLGALRAIYPDSRLLRQTAQLLSYESDALTAYRARPIAVVLPESADEVIATVRACHQAGVPFVARGSGTSLSGGSLPIEGGIVIGLNRLDRILELDPDERIAVVEPGVVNLKVSEAAAPYGLYYAPDPSSQSVCTIGGNVAFNSGGAHCLRYGMTSNHVLGLKVVLADGTVTQLGGRSLEGVGPDLHGLFVGSEGLFGVALEITLRLLPRAETWFTLLAAYDSLEAAGNAVARVIASGLLPAAMEIMDRLAIKAAEAAVHAGYPQRRCAAHRRARGRVAGGGRRGGRAARGHRRVGAERDAHRARRRRARSDLERPQGRLLGGGSLEPRLRGAGRRRSPRAVG